MESLTLQEEIVMQAIWKQKEGFIRDFMEDISPEMPYTTVASIVKKLEQKQFVQAKKMANSFMYTVLITADDYNNAKLSSVVKDYFKNSYKDLVSFFVKEEKITEKELKEIISLIEQKK